MLEKDTAADEEVIGLNGTFLCFYPDEALQVVIVVNVEDLTYKSSTCKARVVNSKTGRLSMCLEVMNTFFIGSNIPM